MNGRVVINVVSGKGGTGKTLLCAVLADLLGSAGIDTLVIDLDIFVRGLTSLLYFHKQEALRLTEHDQLCVADFLIRRRRSGLTKDLPARIPPAEAELGIARYRTFDVLPSVRHINERLNYTDIMPSDRKRAEVALRNLLSRIPPRYKFVILDSRAGYDELIAATTLLSDVTLSVEEEDDISRVTAENLAAQLEKDGATPLFRVINKARRVRTIKELDRTAGVNNLGRVPFDIDVMNSFGTRTFWEDIAETLYYAGVVRMWNRLNTKMQFGVELPEPRTRPLPGHLLERLLGAYPLRDRVFLVYAALIAIIGLAYAFSSPDTWRHLMTDPMRMLMAVFGLGGVIVVLLSIGRAGHR